MGEAVARSPLAGRAVTVAGKTGPPVLHFAEVPFRAQIGLRADAGGPAAGRIATALGAPLPGTVGEVVHAGGLRLLRLGPDEWLIIGARGDEERIRTGLASALDGDPGSVVDLSGHRTIIRLSGARAREVLNKGCSLDLHPRVFPPDRCAQTLLGRAQVVLVSRDGDGPDYWILVRSSFARHLFAWLSDAAAEYGTPAPEGGEPQG